jgi:hypothetical protein
VPGVRRATGNTPEQTLDVVDMPQRLAQLLTPYCIASQLSHSIQARLNRLKLQEWLLQPTP